MRNFIFLLFTILAIASITNAAQYALVAGGSAEDIDKKKPNFFAADFKTYNENLAKRGWQVTTLFDNDISKIPGSKTATNQNIDEGIYKIIEKIKPGDQVLLTFHAHGRDSELRFGGSHSIVSESPGGYDLGKLEEYADKIKEKGGTVAVVDLSCYSGHTQNLNGDSRKSNERACIVTLASEKYVSICSGDKASNSFTSAFINLPSPTVKLSLEKHFLASREKDGSSSNLPQISSIDLPSKKFWDFFLSVGDPNSVSREDGFRVGNTEAAVCQFCEKAGQFTEEIAKLKKLAETVKGGGKELSNRLMDSFQNYMASYGEVSASVEKIQKKMGQIPTWGFTEPALSQLNKVSLGRMGTFVELTAPNVQLKDIKCDLPPKKWTRKLCG